MRTLMHTDTQGFLNHCSAPATALACAAWINLDIRPTSIFRFVARIGGELIPCSIRDAFRQAVVFDHPCDAQVLKHDCAETVHQLVALLMGKVLASVRYPLMDAGNDFASFDSPWCSLWLLTQATLRSFQVMFIAAKEARVVDRLARRERSELHQSDIYANGG